MCVREWNFCLIFLSNFDEKWEFILWWRQQQQQKELIKRNTKMLYVAIVFTHCTQTYYTKITILDDKIDD